MTINSLLKKTNENYEMAVRTGSKYSIINVFMAYDTLYDLYRLELISEKTFSNLFPKFYSIAKDTYLQCLSTNEEMRDELIKESYTINFFKEMCDITEQGGKNNDD